MTDQTTETVTKQKNPLRIEKGKKLVEYNHRKKAELKWLNEQITKQDGIEHKPKHDTNTYVYVSALSAFVLAILWVPPVFQIQETRTKLNQCSTASSGKD